MFCSNCGNQLTDDARFCEHCGAAVETPAPETTEIAPAPVAEKENPDLNGLATSTLILGIVGLALSEMGLPGLIVSSIGLKKAAEFERKAGNLFGKAKTGRLLAKIGKIVGIVMTIFLAVYFTIFFIVYFGILIGIFSGAL